MTDSKGSAPGIPGACRGALALAAAALVLAGACADHKARAPTGGLGQPCSGGACTAPYVCDSGSHLCVAVPGTCGNGVVDAGEQCDGANLAGQTCATRGMQGAGLACRVDCTFDLSACTAVGAVFPLAISPSKNALVDATGRPFLMQGDAAWSAIAELSETDAQLYLDDRKSRGFNTILVNLVEHQFTDHTPYPANAAGDLPFTGLATCTPAQPSDHPCYDMSATNDAYFAHVDWFLNQALSRGILVLLAPAYMGWGGTQDGWINEMKATGTAKLGTYGQYLGARYKNQPNVIWVNGGDYTPANAGEMALVTAIIDGIQAAGDAHLHTAHWGGYSTYPGEGYTPHPSWIDVDTVYFTNPPSIYSYTLPGYLQDGGVRPVFFIEGNYENEHGTTPLELRSQMYQPLLAGEAGFVMGVGTVWNFWSGGSGGNAYSNDGKYPGGWTTALGSPGAGDAQRAGQLFAGLPWQSLVPDVNNTLITTGYQQPAGNGYVMGARTADGSLALAYFTFLANVTVNMAQMKGLTTAYWFDPSSGAYTLVPGGPFASSGSQQFAPPGNTADGSTDWVLLLESP
jgi:hypothetical protein